MAGNSDKCCCCGDSAGAASSRVAEETPWIDGCVETVAGPVPCVRTALNSADRLGAWKVRWGIGRMSYSVEPGLYAAGSPVPESPVLVSANYKMSFDLLRSRLSGRDAWILVLDTAGVNVWCAAGKGTFGTEELLRRMNVTGLDKIVTHRKLIVPQLGATGVSAHKVKSGSGFRVVYGPVRVADLPAFLDAGMKATPGMREIRFPLRDRFVLTPVELIASGRYALPAAAALALLSGLGQRGYSFSRSLSEGLAAAAILLGAWVVGAVVTPLLLPWLPGRAFSVKGGWAGILYLLAVLWLTAGFERGWATLAAWLFIVPSVTSYLGMNFTGSSTFTSLSGVLKEMRLAVPLQVLCAAVGLAFWITGLFLSEGG